jgi:hypothetical protein
VVPVEAAYTQLRTKRTMAKVCLMLMAALSLQMRQKAA